jgi:NAD(P)-dependent dehydrogenase (short-subunit alcohol dehydrogenase family)
MLLKDKTAVIYGAGAIGGAVARAFAREGASVWLAARTNERLERLASEIRAAGGKVSVNRVDALDETAVEQHAHAVAEQAGGIDIALNAVGIPHVQGTPLADLSYEEYAQPLTDFTRANFLTARAAARHMVRRRRGVLLTLSTPGSRLAGPGFMGYGAACAAIETMTRHLAGELGPSGVRAVCLRSDAIPEALEHGSYSRGVFEHVAARAGTTPAAMLAEHARSACLLGRLPTLAEVAETAAFMASDRAGAITGAVINLTCGSLTDG